MKKSYAGAAFLVGAAIGAGLAILFAPKPGKETREDLLDWLKKKGEEGKDLLQKSREELGQKKDQLAAAIKAGREAYTSARNEREKVAA